MPVAIYQHLNVAHEATCDSHPYTLWQLVAEVSRILAKVVGIGPKTKQDQTSYDPTCGSGSLSDATGRPVMLALTRIYAASRTIGKSIKNHEGYEEHED
jgi:hypothetical protein